jgi:hypothetical protein
MVSSHQRRRCADKRSGHRHDDVLNFERYPLFP